MIVGVCKESFPGERRVAVIPDMVPRLTKRNLEVLVEKGAGLEAGIEEPAFEEKGAKIAAGRSEVFSSADVILQARSRGANPDAGRADLESMRSGQTLIGFSEPLSAPEIARDTAARGVTSFSMELLPRITRAQSIDALSFMATVAGYKAVLLAAEVLPKMFPLFMTAAGTIKAAKVLVVGAGVAGLQAIAAARRLGAVVSAYDIRRAVKEQVQSLGARFVEMELKAGDAEDIPYDKLKEMDEINPTLETVDVALVIGGNDVVNPVARTDPSSPIAGMPIIDVDKCRTVVVIKRSLSPGFAGIPNPLFAADNTPMFFNDGKKAFLELVNEVKGN